MLLFPHLEDIQPRYVYNYCTLSYPLSLPLPKVTCLWFLSAISRHFSNTGKQVPPHAFSLITHLPAQLKAFYLLSSSDITALLPDLDSPVLTPLPSISAGTGGRRLWGCRLWAAIPSHPGGNRGRAFLPHWQGRGATSETWQTGTASYAAPHAPTAAGRQNASEVCTAAPSLNNVRLCRWPPRSHPSTTPLHED